MTDTMPANPKQKYGDTKVPLHLFPSTATALGAMGFLEGRQKYGQDNFRAVDVEAMTYVRATMSHLLAYAEGEWAPSDSPVPHLGLALASLAIIIDAHYAGSLIDNRKFPGGYAKAIAEMQPLVQPLRDMHADKTPRHFTIADSTTGAGHTTVVAPAPIEVWSHWHCGLCGQKKHTHGHMPERLVCEPCTGKISHEHPRAERHNSIGVVWGQGADEAAQQTRAHEGAPIKLSIPDAWADVVRAQQERAVKEQAL